MGDNGKSVSFGGVLVLCGLVLVFGLGVLWIWVQWVGLFPVSGVGGTPNPGEMIVGSGVVTVPRDCFVLVRTDAGIGAFKLTEETNDGDGGVKYVSYFRPDADGSFLDPGARKGEAVVFEKYDRTRLNSGKNFVKDMGGQLWIECGPIRLEWSSGDYIYFPVDCSAEIACTGESDIAAVSVIDSELIWCGRKANPVSKMPEGPAPSREAAERTEEGP